EASDVTFTKSLIVTRYYTPFQLSPRQSLAYHSGCPSLEDWSHVQDLRSSRGRWALFRCGNCEKPNAPSTGTGRIEYFLRLHLRLGCSAREENQSLACQRSPLRRMDSR